MAAHSDGVTFELTVVISILKGASAVHACLSRCLGPPTPQVLQLQSHRFKR